MGIRPLSSSEYSSLSTNGVMHVPLGFYTYSFYINLAQSGYRQPANTLSTGNTLVQLLMCPWSCRPHNPEHHSLHSSQNLLR